MTLGGEMLPNRRRSPESFDILEDEGAVLQKSYPPIFGEPQGHHQNALTELNADQHLLISRLPQSTKNSKEVDITLASPVQPKLPSRGQHRRPPIGDQTFQPLFNIQENSSHSLDWDQPVAASVSPQHSKRIDGDPAHNIINHPLVNATVDGSVEDQVQKQLAGQFDWILAYPAQARQSDRPGSGSNYREEASNTQVQVVYGCNLLRRIPGSSSVKQSTSKVEADTYTFIATQITAPDTMLRPPMEDIEEQVQMAIHQQMTPMSASLKAPEIAQAIEQNASPPMPENKSLKKIVDTLPPQDSSCSDSRIEDSLAEIDRLEDELEAVSAVAGPGREATSDPKKPVTEDGDHHPAPKSSSAAKRVTIAAGQYATVRIKPSERMKPALRRSNSLTFRQNNENHESPTASKIAEHGLGRTKSTSIRQADCKTPVKSSKPLTVPKFELPGEAVSRRLKEQREARQAQQAEARKTYVAPPRPKTVKAPTIPDFELPGEAISRRKREERAAKLKAQEEEERRRREFKAKPFKSNATPSTLPRGTIASRARQSVVGTQTSAPASKVADQSKRSSTHGMSYGSNGVSSTAATMPPLRRGRNSIVLPSEDGSRATSMSSSISEKRSSLSLEDAMHQRVRGKQIYARDNSYAHERELEKRERETAAALARERAAERSRAASREWAEKKKQRELALRQTLRIKEQAEAQ